MSTGSGSVRQDTGGSDLSFRRASADDVDAVVALVNAAYRGESSRAGWTTEADLLGGQRTDAQEILHLIGSADSMILLCLRGGEIVGSVNLQREEGGTAYLGMLVIKPVLQGNGLGSRFLATTEKLARSEWQVVRMQIQVITLRDELIAWYQRRGYRRSGEIRPFPATEPRFGLPKVADLRFEVLEKILALPT